MKQYPNTLQDGTMATDLRQSTSIDFINTLRDKRLIYINNRGQVYLTNKGKLANWLGFQRYFKLEKEQQELFEQELETIQVEIPEPKVEVLSMEFPPERPEGRIIGEGAEAVPALVDALRNEAKVL